VGQSITQKSQNDENRDPNIPNNPSKHYSAKNNLKSFRNRNLNLIDNKTATNPAVDNQKAKFKVCRSDS
jgi:hypothetical protein